MLVVAMVVCLLLFVLVVVFSLFVVNMFVWFIAIVSLLVLIEVLCCGVLMFDYLLFVCVTWLLV